MFGWDTDEYRAAEEQRKAELAERHAPFWRTPSCRAGWLGLLDNFYATARAMLPPGIDGELQMRQVKEKFGTLCIYYHASDRIPDLERHVLHVAKRAAEDASLYTCEVCGGRGVLRVRHGWYATRCDDHADGAEPWQPDREG